MDMSGYFLKTASNVTFRFPIPTTFKADSYLVLRHRLYNGPGTAYTFDGTLDQNNDTIVIEDANGQVVDQVCNTQRCLSRFWSHDHLGSALVHSITNMPCMGWASVHYT